MASDSVTADLTTAINNQTIAISALNDTIINTFSLDLDTFDYIMLTSVLLFVIGFGTGAVVKTLRKT